MYKMETGYTAAHYFAALKLIEQLYKDGHIPADVFRSILEDCDGILDISPFSVYKEDENEEAEVIE